MTLTFFDVNGILCPYQRKTSPRHGELPKRIAAAEEPPGGNDDKEELNMLNMISYNNTPTTRRNVVGYWPFQDDFFRPFWDMSTGTMRTAVKETEQAYLLDAEMAGFEPNEIDVSLQDGRLTIAAEHKEGNENETAFGSRSVRRTFTVEGVDEEHITAQYRNGVLQVTLPKIKEDSPVSRKITVE